MCQTPVGQTSLPARADGPMGDADGPGLGLRGVQSACGGNRISHLAGEETEAQKWSGLTLRTITK